MTDDPQPQDPAPSSRPEDRPPEPRLERGSPWLLILAGIVALALIGVGIYLATQANREEERNNRALDGVRSYVTNLEERRRAQAEGGLDPSQQLSEQELQEFRQEVLRASEEMTGDEAAVARATAGFVESFQAHLGRYNQSIAALEAKQGIAADSLQSLADVRERREIVLAFRDANARLAEFYREAPGVYRQQLAEGGVPNEKVGEMLNAFMEVFGPRREVLGEIRAKDDVIAQNLLKILQLFENQWGAWEFDAAEDQVNFRDPRFQQGYAESFEDLKTATAEKRALEEQLVKMPGAGEATPSAPVAGGDLSGG